MKRFLLVALLMMISSTSFAQKRSKLLPPKHLTEADLRRLDYNSQCTHHNRYTATQRGKLFPFNKAATVKLSSFRSFFDGDTLLRDSTGKEVAKNGKNVFSGDSVNYSSFIELKTLTKLQVNKLTDILYNVGVRKRTRLSIVDPGAKCFNPRNAILFINAKGKTFAYIDICFECERYESNTKKITLGEFCDDKFKLLKNFFASVGIEYGVTKANGRIYN